MDGTEQREQAGAKGRIADKLNGLGLRTLESGERPNWLFFDKGNTAEVQRLFGEDGRNRAEEAIRSREPVPDELRAAVKTCINVKKSGISDALTFLEPLMKKEEVLSGKVWMGDEKAGSGLPKIVFYARDEDGSALEFALEASVLLERLDSEYRFKMAENDPFWAHQVGRESPVWVTQGEVALKDLAWGNGVFNDYFSQFGAFYTGNERRLTQAILKRCPLVGDRLSGLRQAYGIRELPLSEEFRLVDLLADQLSLQNEIKELRDIGFAEEEIKMIAHAAKRKSPDRAKEVLARNLGLVLAEEASSRQELTKVLAERGIYSVGRRVSQEEIENGEMFSAMVDLIVENFRPTGLFNVKLQDERATVLAIVGDLYANENYGLRRRLEGEGVPLDTTTISYLVGVAIEVWERQEQVRRLVSESEGRNEQVSMWMRHRQEHEAFLDWKTFLETNIGALRGMLKRMPGSLNGLLFASETRDGLVPAISRFHAGFTALEGCLNLIGDASLRQEAENVVYLCGAVTARYLYDRGVLSSPSFGEKRRAVVNDGFVSELRRYGSRMGEGVGIPTTEDFLARAEYSLSLDGKPSPLTLQETQNMDEILLLLFRHGKLNGPVTIDFLAKINKLETRGRYPGLEDEDVDPETQFRKGSVAVGKRPMPQPEELSDLMESFIVELNHRFSGGRRDLDFACELAAWAHVKLTDQIHPYMDGNGGTARWLASFIISNLTGEAAFFVPRGPYGREYYGAFGPRGSEAEKEQIERLASLFKKLVYEDHLLDSEWVV